jgi:hypothetical protein
MKLTTHPSARATCQFPLRRAILPLVILWLLAISSACEISTTAEGIVTDSATGLPIANAHVTQLAIHKKTEQVVCEGYTDSTGSFSITAGLSGFGPRKTRLLVVIQKDGYEVFSTRNEYQKIEAKLVPK